MGSPVVGSRCATDRVPLLRPSYLLGPERGKGGDLPHAVSEGIESSSFYVRYRPPGAYWSGGGRIARCFFFSATISRRIKQYPDRCSSSFLYGGRYCSLVVGCILVSFSVTLPKGGELGGIYSSNVGVYRARWSRRGGQPEDRGSAAIYVSLAGAHHPLERDGHKGYNKDSRPL